MSLARRTLRPLVPTAVVVLLGGVVTGAYVLTRAPLYNPLQTIDPWLYTAVWTNFHQIYGAFASTYYTSRVPWIAPGYALNSVLGAKAAFLLLHTTLFFVGGLLLFLTARRQLGLAAAAVAYVALIGSQTYYDAHRWDYEEGGVLFLIIATGAAAAWAPRSPRLKLLAAFLGGFCAAALVATRIVDVIYLAGMAALYWAARAPLRRVEWRKRVLLDSIAFLTGAAVLVLLCGVFASANGGEFFFFMPQVRVLFTSAGEANHLPVHLWLPSTPSFFVPFFVFVVGVIASFSRRPIPHAARRMQIAATIWLGVSLFIVSGWEFLGHGFVFEYVFYFSSLLPPTALCLGAAVPALMGPLGRRMAAAVVVASTLAVLGPLLWLYRSDDPTRFPTHYGDGPYLAALAAIGLGVSLVLVAVSLRRTLIGALAVAVAVFAASYGLDSGSGTREDGVSDSRTGALYSLGQDMIAFLSKNGFTTASTLPRFWYDDPVLGVHRPTAVAPSYYFTALQSLYYFSYTFVGLSMPTMDGDFRLRMNLYKPDRLVLLCETIACRGGPEALRRAGYEPKLQARRRLVRSPLSVWVAIYRLGKPPS